jgi:hypothetical protein
VKGVDLPRKLGRKVRADEDHALLGTDRDDVLAARFGCSANAVKSGRVQRRIPAFRDRRRRVDQ